MGAEVPDQIYFPEGKICHRIIQDHVAGIKEHPALSHIPLKFEKVELGDKDESMEFKFSINKMYKKLMGVEAPLSREYHFHGYRDGLKADFSAMLEIKSSSTLWSIGKFMKAMQRKCYGLDDRLTHAYLITCPRNPKLWNKIKPKYYKVPYTKQDQIDAIKWIVDGAMILDKGEFSGGLDENGNCCLPRCNYGFNCQFR